VITLAEFFADVDRIHRHRRAAGVARVYFRHRTFVPNNVCEVWEDVPLNEVPAAGDVLDMAGTGSMGAEGRWRVRDREWHAAGGAATVYVEDAKEQHVRDDHRVDSGSD
jgi:hypothetical protein